MVFRRAVLAAILMSAVVIETNAVAQHLIPDEPTCRSCSIRSRVVTQIGDVDGPGAIPGLPMAFTNDASGRYWSVFRGATMIFNPDGRFLRPAGKRGQGPGEFTFVRVLTPLPGDSMLLLDIGGKITIMGPDLSPARYITMRVPSDWFSATVIKWPGTLLVNGLLGTPDKVGWPLHTFGMSGDAVRILKSFGDNRGELRPDMSDRLRQHVLLALDGTIWAGDRFNYRLTQWDSNGNLKRTTERRPAWFREESSGLDGGPNTPPPPQITGMHFDRSGRVWVYAIVAKPTWRQAWKDVPRIPAGSETTEGPAFEELFQSRIEIIDPRTARVVTTATYKDPIIAALPNGLAAAYTVDASGVPRFSIISLTLVGS